MRKRPAQRTRIPAVHQLVPRLAWGDAVGNQVRYLQALFKDWGHPSEIFADQWDESCRDQARPATLLPRAMAPGDLLLVHHSFQSRLVPLLKRTPGRKALVYHNITPSRLFEGFDRKLALACTAARDELLALQPLMERAYAYSHFSAEELRAAGYPAVSVLPFAVDWRAFDVAPDEALKAALQEDGCVNILFVGRAVPSKRIDDVMRVFAAYQRLYQPHSRLIIVGYLNRETPYGAHLLGVKELLAAERVRFLGRVSAAQLSACYATATAYLSMSRHEGFGVPLLEAMHRNVPVVAYGAAAVPETLGGAGITTLTHQPEDIAQVLAVLERREDLRQRLIAGQRERLRALDQEAIATQVRQGLRPFLEGHSSAPPERLTASVELVCPALSRWPEAPLSRMALHLASNLAGSRLLTLHAAPASGPSELKGDGNVWRFMPDQPLPPHASEALPGSSSLEMALRRSQAPVVFLGADTAVARASLPYVSSRAWGIREAADSPGTALLEGQPGLRLLTLDPTTPEATAASLLEALATFRKNHARE
ncbi:glycosyltransferase [Stigmatella sp. ncwal1]|uniref:Glycosyltransferase n=1 Tax=Stigmatella ashevillensis TaxID=2995309 RepID=A0ABT5DNJ7_9BACT|nr:glycosyltransferase [Stigmatella ashevillena]MDC0715240.1 glycosyltransferase [Stigmatella ashevillena]